MKKDKSDGLHIQIEVSEKRLTHRFLVKIIFMNTAPNIAEFPFSNLKRKAELIGLQITDQSGNPIEPEPGLLIRPKNKDLEPHRIMPGGSWVYNLRGKRRKGRLEFPGAIYELEPKKTYKFRFQHKGIWSNTVEWTVPA
jgi:hypothetical protein